MRPDSHEIFARRRSRNIGLGLVLGAFVLLVFAVSVVKIGGGAIPNSVVIAVLGFIFLYFMSIVMLTFLMILSGLDFMTALGAIVASINNAGPGLNKVGPATNYAVLTDFQTWVCSFTMLLGRLEVLSLAVVFTPQFWRK